MQHEPTPVPIAIRVYPEPPEQESRSSSGKKWRRPEAMLVFDTETRTDPTQRLTFGSYRFIVAGECLEEGLFYADDLPAKDRKVLEQYVAHSADAAKKDLRLVTRRQFLAKFYKAAYKGRCLVVGFNLPFDISRLAFDVKAARGRFAGGFSLGLWTYFDKKGQERPSMHRPRIGVKQIDSKRALKGFTARDTPDDVDLIPEGSTTGMPEKGFKFRGHFLDLRTLAFALTDRGYSLESACEDFGVEHPKKSATDHGRVTEKYIDYNRRDVLASAELAVKLLEEYDKHPISLQVTKAYSPASIGKAYLRAMGIKPVIEQPGFPKKYLGYAQSAFFGGRTSAHIRKVAVPVVYTDFLSMYPTVNNLMNLWSFVIAREIRVVEHCRAEIQKFLNRVTADDLFNPKTWKRLTGFVKIIPDGDILPSRARYTQQSNDWQVGVNHLHGDASTALWFSLPDVVASVLLTGRVPKVLDAFRIEARGKLRGLNPVKLRGTIEVDPKAQDFFKVVIEERKRLALRTDLSDAEKKRLDKALKVLANASSYGIYAEMNRQENDRQTRVTCHGIDGEPFICRVAHPDVPGEYCFPPLASLITGAARLMLALLEYCVRELGGTYAMEDTDSMAIVANENGGEVLCAGGRVKALSWKQVREISERFPELSPYDPKAIPGSILKIEKDNFEPRTGRQRQLYCLAISAKRYALFVKDKNGSPVLLRKGVNNDDDRWSEHGLGHLLNPTDPEREDREWIAQVWQRLIRSALGLATENVDFARRPAVGRITVSSHAVMRPLENLNLGKSYPDQIKPFNFLLSCHVAQLGQPVGADPAKFHLVGPYETDARRWLETKWIDQYSRKEYRITTTDLPSRTTACVKTYGNIATEYEFHPESKCADADRNPCGKQTVGLLQRRHIRIDQIKYIGKESNRLEEVEEGLIHSDDSVYTEYPDPRRDEWENKVVPALKKIPLSRLAKLTGLSRRTLIYARVGQRRPHKKHQQILAAIVTKLDMKVHDPKRKTKHAIQKRGR
jgi:hypothetical protein